MLTIEEKDGLTERPPHRQYKTPRHLLPELEKFITEMLQKGWIEPSTSEYSSPVLIIPKPPPSKKYRFVVDLRAVNERTKRLTHYMPDLSATTANRGCRHPLPINFSRLKWAQRAGDSYSTSA